MSRRCDVRAVLEPALARRTKFTRLRYLAMRRGEGSGVDRIDYPATRVLERDIAAGRASDELVRGRVVNTCAADKAALLHDRNEIAGRVRCLDRGITQKVRLAGGESCIVVWTGLVRSSTEARKRNLRPCRIKPAGTRRIGADTAGIARHLWVTGVAEARALASRTRRKKARRESSTPSSGRHSASLGSAPPSSYDVAYRLAAVLASGERLDEGIKAALRPSAGRGDR